MTTRMPSSWSRMLLALTLSTAVLFAAPNATATNCADELNELTTTLAEIEAIGTDIADQRDRAIALAAQTRTERDVCVGSRAEVDAIAAGLRVTVADYERTIAKIEARPKPSTWYALGVATPIVAAGLAVLVYLAVK